MLAGDDVIVPQIDRQHSIARTLYIGGSAEQAEAVKSAHEKGDERALGLALGYPETAVEAYMDSTVIPMSNVSTDPKDLAFRRFLLSPGHAAEELQTVRRWTAAVAQTSPDLYAEVMRT